MIRKDKRIPIVENMSIKTGEIKKMCHKLWLYCITLYIVFEWSQRFSHEKVLIRVYFSYSYSYSYIYSSVDSFLFEN
jgi:hypothetical protein